MMTYLLNKHIQELYDINFHTRFYFYDIKFYKKFYHLLDRLFFMMIMVYLVPIIYL